MENRFGVKDLLLVVLLVVVIALIVLSMEQYDRQWQLVQQSNRLLTEQTTDLAKIRRLLEQGVGVPTAQAPGAGTTSQPASIPMMAGFDRILHSQQQPDYATGDDLVNTFRALPEKLTPLVSNEASGTEIRNFVLDGLVERDPETYKWLPRLAESWKISDDQLTIDFNLRRGITFSDGSEFTADDVVFTFDLTRNPQIEAPAAQSYLDKLGSVTKTGDYGVRFVFKEPYFLSFEIAGGNGILSKKFYSRFSPTEINRSTGLLIGTGPYRLPDPTAWKPEAGKPIELVRNERYWGPTPAFNKLIWKTIELPSAALTAFTNGETDTYSPSPDQFDQLCANPEVVARTQHFALDRPNSGFGFIGWNEKVGRDGKPSQFADARVRRALTMLIDRDTICKKIMNGHATVNTGPFSVLTPQADPTIQPWPYDRAAAEKLLAEAGFIRHGSQILDPDGNPFQFKLTYPSVAQTTKRIVSYIHDSFAQSGIDVTPDPADWSVLLQHLRDRDYQAVAMGYTGGLEFDVHQIFDSSEMAGAGEDFVQYKNPETDAAIEQARQIVNDDKRMPVWHKVHQLLHQDQPYTFLYISKQLEFISGRFKGVSTTKMGITSDMQLEWYVPKPLQKYAN